MRAHSLYCTLLILGLTTIGCAANVDEPVQQIPDPPPQREPAAQPFGGDLRVGITDPIMRAILEQNNDGAGDLPPRQEAILSPLPPGE